MQMNNSESKIAQYNLTVSLLKTNRTGVKLIEYEINRF